MNKKTIKLPYHANIELFDKMLTDLKTSGTDGTNLNTLWANINATGNLIAKRTFTLNLGKFLGLIDNDTKKIWLTDLGSTLRYMNKVDKNKKLAAKLPDKYLTMFKWIRDKKEMPSNDLKRRFLETWGQVISAVVLDRVIMTFLNYCDWLEIITYQGRGIQAKAVITDLGIRVLESNPDEITSSYQSNNTTPIKERLEELSLPKDAVFPIIIKTMDREFVWDIKTSEDLNVINSVITSIKEGWKIKQPENSSNHTKREKDRKPST